MSATTPEQVHHEFIEALHAGDVDRLVSLYAPQAAMVPEPGRVARGHEQIRAALTHLLSQTERMTFEAKQIVEVDDVAYICNRWTRVGTDGSGKRVEDTGVAVEFVQRGADGIWRFLIGNPWGDRLAG